MTPLTPRERARRVLDLLRTTEGVDALEEALARELEDLQPATGPGADLASRADHDAVARALREGGNELAARVLDAVPGGVVVVAQNGAVLQANAEALRILGLSYDALTLRYVSDFRAETLNEDGSPCPVEDYPVTRCLATGQPQPPRLIGVRHPGGEVTWAVFRAVPLKDPETRAPVGSVVTFIDISDRLRAEEALRRSEERFRTLVQSSPSYIFVADREGRIVFINRSAPAFALHEVLGKTVFELGTPESHAPFCNALEAAFERGEASRFEGTDTRGASYESHMVPLTDQGGRVTQVMVISTDITERRRAEAERRRLDASIGEAQRLGSLSLFAGGVAHDFNNLLVGIRGNVELALQRLPDDAAARPLLDDARKATLRASELTEQLLAYSGQRTEAMAPLSLNALTEEMAQLLRVTTSKKATLRLELDPTLPAVEADATQVRQVLMNLIGNASDALGDRSGTIVVRTRTASLDEVRAAANALPPPPRAEGRFVLLAVQDDGCGMTPETRQHIFDPFFTTKFAGHGLGLAAVLGIVRAHGGAIGVESAPGRGATFTIALPTRGRPAPPAAPEPPPARQEEAPRPAERPMVLVVDDEKHVRSVARIALEGGGFQVLTASDGREAVGLFEQHAPRVKAVVLDLLMPDMDGGEAFEALRRIRPDVPIILSSGFGEETATQRLEGQGGLAGFLKKPYHLDELLRLVRGAVR